MKIADFIGEVTEYDKKERLEERKPKSWLKSVSAFANGVGGALIFGVADDDTPVGLANARADSEKISETIKARIDPVPEVILSIHAEESKQFIVLQIKRGNETPYYYVGDGSMTAYIRIGNESVPANAAVLRRLVPHGSGKHYDALPSRYKIEDLAFTKLRSVYRMRTGKELEESDFISFSLANEDGVLTNGGALLSDDPPLRHSRLFCTRWFGLDKASGIMDAIDDKEFEGSLVSLLQDGDAFVKTNTKKRWKKTGHGRVEMPEYPEQAVFESIVNALIHRDYLETGSEVHIDIFDDRLEIYSPGGMYDGSLVQELDTNMVPSRRRNPVIADVFSRMHYMERRGSGFRKIKADYHNAVNFRPELEPKFSSTPTSFFVTLYNLNYNVPIAAIPIKVGNVAVENSKVAVDEEKVAVERRLSSITANAPTKNKTMLLFDVYGYDGVFGRAEIMQMFGMASSSAGKLLIKLKELYFIEPVSGHGKGKYRFVAK